MEEIQREINLFFSINYPRIIVDSLLIEDNGIVMVVFRNESDHKYRTNQIVFNLDLDNLNNQLQEQAEIWLG